MPWSLEDQFCSLFQNKITKHSAQNRSTGAITSPYSNTNQTQDQGGVEARWEAWRSSSRIWPATSRTAPGPCGMNTGEDFEAAPISFMVSKYWVARTISMTSFAVVPGTLTENPNTLSLKPSTIAWR